MEPLHEQTRVLQDLTVREFVQFLTFAFGENLQDQLREKTWSNLLQVYEP